MGKITRVLVIDDSPTFRSLLKIGLETAPGLQVVGAIPRDNTALNTIMHLRPDVITIDLSVPYADSQRMIEQIMQRTPTPVLGLTASQPDKVVFNALIAGAVDIANKPQSRGQELIALANHVRMLAQIDIQTHLKIALEQQTGWKLDDTTGNLILPSTSVLRHTAFPIVILVAATGGPIALAHILGKLPPNLKAATLIVQHLPPGFAPGLAEWLTEITPHQVRLIDENTIMRPRQFFLVPDNYRVEIGPENTIHLSDTPDGHTGHPSADVLLETAAEHCKQRVIAAILTGSGQDGAQGTQAVKQAGGHILIQDQATSLIYDMPQASQPHADTERSLEEISNWLMRRIRDLKQLPSQN